MYLEIVSLEELKLPSRTRVRSHKTGMDVYVLMFGLSNAVPSFMELEDRCKLLTRPFIGSG